VKTTKLNFVGKAAESKEFKNAQLVKGLKLRYGSYDVPVPIGRYSEGRMERILASFVNHFTSDDVRILIDHPKDNNGHTCSTESLRVHIVPPLSKKEREEEDKREKEILKAQAIQDKARLKEQKRVRAQLAKKVKARLEEAEKPKKKAKKKKTTRKRVKK
tara:strand:+ start:345 stop:824 length:480 start_codon:yes stop_codon:yes gene_type:complete